MITPLNISALVGSWVVAKTNIPDYTDINEMLRFTAKGDFERHYSPRPSMPRVCAFPEHFELTTTGYLHFNTSPVKAHQVDAWFEDELLAIKPRHGYITHFKRLDATLPVA